MLDSCTRRSYATRTKTSVIEANKDLYYQALRRTQTTLRHGTSDWEPWVGFFFRCLKKQKDNLVRRIEQEETPDTETDNLPTLSIQILDLVKAHERRTISQLVEQTGANKNTIKVRLRELVCTGLLHRHGKARGTWYSM